MNSTLGDTGVFAGDDTIGSADGTVVITPSITGGIQNMDLSAKVYIDKVQTDLKALVAANSTWGAFQTAVASWAAE